MQLQESPELRQIKLVFVTFSWALQGFSDQDQGEAFSIRPPHLDELIVIAEHELLPTGTQKQDFHVSFRKGLDRFCSDGFGLEPRSVIPTLRVSPCFLDGDLGWYEKRAGKLVLQATELLDST